MLQKVSERLSEGRRIIYLYQHARGISSSLRRHLSSSVSIGGVSDSSSVISVSISSEKRSCRQEGEREKIYSAAK